MGLHAFLNDSWEGEGIGEGAIPEFDVDWSTPAPGQTLTGVVPFGANPIDPATGQSTGAFNSHITSVKLWRGLPEAPVAELASLVATGYGWIVNFDTATLADSTWNFHIRFTLTDASVRTTANLFLPTDNVTAPPPPPPTPTDAHNQVRSRVFLGTNVEISEKEAAWGDRFTGRKKFAGGRTWSQWITNGKSLMNEASPTSEEKLVTLTLAPQNECKVTAITGTTNPVITTSEDMEIQTGDSIVLFDVKWGGTKISALSSSAGSRKRFVVTRLGARSFRLDGQTFEGSYNASDQADAKAGWGQIELNAGRFDSHIRQLRDAMLAKLASYSPANRAAYLQRIVWSPWHENNGDWYSQANKNDKTYDHRSGALAASRSAWQRYYRIMMYEESGYSGAVPTSARAGSLVQLYGARALKWGIEWANFDAAVNDAIGWWPGDEFVDIVAMNMYALTQPNNQTINVWDGTSKGKNSNVQQSVTKRGIALGILPAGYDTDGKGDCQKRALEFLAAWARNTNGCRNSTGMPGGDSRTLTCGIGEWSAVALKEKSGQQLTYASDAVPLQQVQGVYDWGFANRDILHRIVVFDVDKDEGYFAMIRPFAGWTPRAKAYNVPADAPYRAHTGVNTARSSTPNVASHRPAVSNKFLDVFGRR